ncbi:MAG: hypothetical protein ACKOOH_09730, partial [Cyanobium sp.]
SIGLEVESPPLDHNGTDPPGSSVHPSVPGSPARAGRGCIGSAPPGASAAGPGLRCPTFHALMPCPWSPSPGRAADP